MAGLYFNDGVQPCENRLVIPQKKRRLWPRYKVWPETVVTINVSGTVVIGRVKNIGGGGCYVQIHHSVFLDGEFGMTIDFVQGQKGRNCIYVIGKVVRVEEDGIAIQFTKIDIDQLSRCLSSKIDYIINSLSDVVSIE